jgi:hypothetical protein
MTMKRKDEKSDEGNIAKYLNTETTSQKIAIAEQIAKFFSNMKTGDKVTNASLVMFLEDECNIAITAAIKTDVVLEVCTSMLKTNNTVKKVKSDVNNKWSRIVYVRQ